MVGRKGRSRHPNSHYERQGKRRDARRDECMALEIVRRSRLALQAEAPSRSRCSNVVSATGLLWVADSLRFRPNVAVPSDGG